MGGGLTSCSVQSAPTFVTLEVLGSLVKGEDLQVVEITLAVVAPRPLQELLQGRATSFLAHRDDCE